MLEDKGPLRGNAACIRQRIRSDRILWKIGGNPVIQLLLEILWPIAFYELSTEISRTLLSGYGSLMVQTVSAAITSVILGIIYRRNPFSPNRNIEEKSVKTLKTEILCAGVLLCMAGISSSLLFNNLITLSGIKKMFTGYNRIANQLFSPPLWFRIIAMGVVISAAEELVFRGFIYRSLRNRYSFWTAAMVSALLFGWYHGNLVQGIYGWAVALVLAYGYERYKSIWAPWLIHGSANLTSILAGRWIKFEGGKPGISFLLITIVSGVCLFLILHVMRRSNFKCLKEVTQ